MVLRIQRSCSRVTCLARLPAAFSGSRETVNKAVGHARSAIDVSARSCIVTALASLMRRLRVARELVEQVERGARREVVDFERREPVEHATLLGPEHRRLRRKL